MSMNNREYRYALYTVSRFNKTFFSTKAHLILEVQKSGEELQWNENNI